MISISRNVSSSFAIIVLGFAISVTAHGHGQQSNELPAHVQPSVVAQGPGSYHQHKAFSSWIVAHILLMSLAWIFILPIGVALSISRSRYAKPIQLGFLVCNATGLVVGIVYNSRTPDLYPGNAHHKLGWAVTFLTMAQVIVGMLVRSEKPEHFHNYRPLLRGTGIEQNRVFHDTLSPIASNRFSQDSGHGTISASGSRSASLSDENRSSLDVECEPLDPPSRSDWSIGFSFGNPSMLFNTLKRVTRFWYNVVDRTILLLGFAALCTGWITYGGLFKAGAVFNGLAHFIKGGVFMWFGIFSLGRWAGAFQDIGWAWNVRPAMPMKRKLSAEFLESFLIFFYGSTNIFLEHLAGWGKEWTAVDLEHVSLTIMFIGGGLLGMLIESRQLHEVLTGENLKDLKAASEKDGGNSHRSNISSINPIPALIIILLGKMMSSHHQESMVSTMVHAQWGNLLMGAGLARIGTYILLFLSPRKSIMPSRPPTELLTSFGLIAGGIIFMASSRDVVETIELYELDAMFVYTVTMGMVMLLMSWTVVVLAIKSWASRLEQRSATDEALESVGQFEA